MVTIVIIPRHFGLSYWLLVKLLSMIMLNREIDIVITTSSTFVTTKSLDLSVEIRGLVKLESFRRPSFLSFSLFRSTDRLIVHTCDEGKTKRCLERCMECGTGAYS